METNVFIKDRIYNNNNNNNNSRFICQVINNTEDKQKQANAMSEHLSSRIVIIHCYNEEGEVKSFIGCLEVLLGN